MDATDETLAGVFRHEPKHDWYKIVIPSTIYDTCLPGGSDRVCFLLDGSSTTDACYINAMQSLNRHTYACYPADQRDSILPWELYSRWIALCQENRLVVPTAKPSRYKQMNVLHFDGHNYHPHEVYATLCCYRWAENQATMPYYLVQLHDRHPLPFYQLLHYCMARFVHWVNHSFCNVNNQGSKYSIYGRGSNTFYLPHGLSAAYFFLNKRWTGEAAQKYHSTNGAIRNYLTQIIKLEDTPNGYNLCCTTIEQILEEHWSELYTEERSSEYIKEHYNKWKGFQ